MGPSVLVFDCGCGCDYYCECAYAINHMVVVLWFGVGCFRFW